MQGHANAAVDAPLPTLQGNMLGGSSLSAGILLFAAASPVAAVLTYGLLSALPFMSQGGNIPLAVLFSGGTVLYAATMHILPSALGSHGQAHHHVDSLGGAAISEKTSRASPQLMQQRQLIQLLLVSAGMLMPLVLTAVVHHEHQQSRCACRTWA